MIDTVCEARKFDVAAEYERLLKMNQELYVKGFISGSAARKAVDKIEHWRNANRCHQIVTNT